MAKLLLEKPDVLLLDEPTNFLDKDHVSSLKDSFTKYTSKATTIGRAQGLMQKHFETLRPLLFYPKNTFSCFRPRRMLSRIQVSLHPSLLFNGICILSFIIGIIKPINRHNKVIPSHKPERYDIIEVNDYAD